MSLKRGMDIGAGVWQWDFPEGLATCREEGSFSALPAVQSTIVACPLFSDWSNEKMFKSK